MVTPGAAAGVSLSTVLTGYSRPVLVTAPRGTSRKFYIVEQTGTDQGRHLLGRHGGRRSARSWTSGTRSRYDGIERGLLGLAFAPDYATSHRFYVNYTRKSDGATVVAEFKRSSKHTFVASKASLSPGHQDRPAVRQPQRRHDRVRQGRSLYIGMGDGGDHDDPAEPGPEQRQPAGQDVAHQPA